MADDEAPTGTGTIEKPLAMFVRGGTSTSADDKQRQMRHADAERRRDQQDAQFAATRKGTAQLRSMKLGGAHTHPSIVLWIKETLKELDPRNFMLCELSSQPLDGGGVDLMLMMNCPRCIFRHNRHPEDTIMHVRQSNRNFTFEDKVPAWLQKRWQGRLWINPEDASETCTVAGTITMHERGHCPVCHWTFTIDDSVLHTLN